MYVSNHADRTVECVAIAVRELCDMRDSDDTQAFSDSELNFMIDMLCTSKLMLHVYIMTLYIINYLFFYFLLL